MKQKNRAVSIGLVVFLIGSAILFIERITHAGISGAMAKLYCGGKYLQASAQPGDGMCGFNMDMVVGGAGFLLIVTGVFLILIGLVKMIAKRFKK